jgi:2-oxoglutarate ferredoxin oxidoreductase subunit delta
MSAQQTKLKPLTTFDEDACKGCELCIVACPQEIIVLSEKLNAKGYHPATIIDMDKCTACQACARMCPDSVITVKKV